MNPSHTIWLMPGDSEAYWLNWLFYQQSPLFQIPLFGNYAYGEELSLSIALNDSIPLMAFFFKIFQNYIPFESQYFGIWIFLCFFFQSFFSIRLLSKFSNDNILILFFSIFFLLSPILLWRLWGHYSLMAHWLILASFYIYFNSKFNLFHWISLFFVSFLTSAYITFMVFIIFATDIFRRQISHELSFKELQLVLMKFFSFSIISLYLIGYIYEGTKLSASGYGIYKANLSTFFDSNGLWSLIFPDIFSHMGEHEGFAFLGSGVILLIGIIILISLFKKEKIIFFDNNSHKYISIVAIVLFLFALSNNVSVGHFDLISIKFPNFLEKLFGILRASGRMVWILFYLIYLIIFINISKSKYKKSYKIILLCLISFQLFDMNKASELFRKKTGDINKNYKEVYLEEKYRADGLNPDTIYNYWEQNLWNSPMKSPEWDRIGKEYKRISYVYAKNKPKRYFPLALFAAKNKMTINFGRFSRIKKSKSKEINKKLEVELSSRAYRDDTLYYFDSKSEWLIALKNKRGFDLIKEIDGFKILAPKYYINK